MNARRELQLAARAFAAASDGFGDEAERLETAAVSFAAARAAERPRRPRERKMTATLGEWLDAWRSLAAQLGRAPQLAEVAAARGRSLTAAHAAVKRLRALNAIDPPAE